MRSPFSTPLDVRMHQRQASVKSQVVAQPLLLSSMFRQDISNNINAAAGTRTSASSNSSSSLHRRSSLLKRDSAVSIGHAGSRSDVRRISMRRSFQSSEAAFVEDDLAEFLAEQPAAMGPVYRLVRLAAIPFLPVLTPTLPPCHRNIRVDDAGRLTDHRRCSEERPLRANGSSVPRNIEGNLRLRRDQILLILRDLRLRPNTAR